MKRAMFCVMFIAVSLISGWCWADFFYYCETKEVATTCTGTVTGREPLGGTVNVQCILSGGKLYTCKFTPLPWYYCDGVACKGTTAGSGGLSACHQFGGSKGCTN